MALSQFEKWAAGVTETLWEIEDVVKMVEDWEAARRLEHDANP